MPTVERKIKEDETEMRTRTLIMPPPLSKGDKVVIIAPSQPVERKSLKVGRELLTKWKLHPTFAPHIGKNVGGFASGEQEKIAAEMTRLVEDGKYKAMLCALGGDSIIGVLEHFDKYQFFQKLRKNPIHLVGYSEFSAILTLAFLESGIVGWHAPNLLWLSRRTKTTQEMLRKSLFDGKSAIKNLSLSSSEGGVISGEGGGRLLVVNLRTFKDLLASKLDLWGEVWGKVILAVEDHDDPPTEIYRRLLAVKTRLKKDRQFREKIGGILFDANPSKEEAYNFFQEGFKGSFKTMMEKVFGELKIPVAIFPSMVVCEATANPKRQTMLTLPVGWPVKLTVEGKGAFLKFADDVNARFA